MRSVLFFPLLSLLFFCCKRDTSEVSTSTDSYFFDCTVDGKKIRLDSKSNLPNLEAGKSLSAQVNTQIQTLVNSLYCDAPGSYCFSQTMTVLSQQTGTFKPKAFVIQITEGATTYNYIYPSNSPKGDITVKISTIQRGTPPGSGVCKGEFSGTIAKFIGGSITGTSTSINGTFALPIYYPLETCEFYSLVISK